MIASEGGERGVGGGDRSGEGMVTVRGWGAASWVAVDEGDDGDDGWMVDWGVSTGAGGGARMSPRAPLRAQPNTMFC